MRTYATLLLIFCVAMQLCIARHRVKRNCYTSCQQPCNTCPPVCQPVCRYYTIPRPPIVYRICNTYPSCSFQTGAVAPQYQQFVQQQPLIQQPIIQPQFVQQQPMIQPTMIQPPIMQQQPAPQIVDSSAQQIVQEPQQPVNTQPQMSQLSPCQQMAALGQPSSCATTQQ